MNKQSNKEYKQWLGLSLLFIFLGIDEFVSFHELLSGPVRTVMDINGVLYLAWVIPYGLLSLVIFLIYAKFLFRLPLQIRMMFIISGFLYVSGAIGCEVIGSRYYSTGNTNDIGYAIIYTLEELLEMTGVALFIYSLLIYMRTKAVISIVNW